MILHKNKQTNKQTQRSMRTILHTNKTQKSMRISILGTNVTDSKYSSHNQVLKNPKKIPSGSTANTHDPFPKISQKTHEKASQRKINLQSTRKAHNKKERIDQSMGTDETEDFINFSRFLFCRRNKACSIGPNLH